MDHNVHEEKVPIRGWLVLIGIIVWATTIGEVLTTLTTFLFTQRTTVTLTEAVLSLIGSTIAITVLVLFMSRKRSFARWFIVLQAYSVVYNIVIVSMGVTNAAGIIMAIIESVILTMYVLRSERVKNTFVR